MQRVIQKLEKINKKITKKLDSGLKSDDSDFDEEEECPRFWAIDSFSVQTKRQFGLLRGKPIKNALELLHAESERRRNRRPSYDSGLEMSPPPEEDVQPAPIIKPTAPPISRPNFAKDTKPYKWNWPLGAPKIINNEDRFEVQLPLGSFQPDEVWAVVVGNGLTIRCDATNRGDHMEKIPGKNRYILRMYTLPLNVDPQTAEFSIVQNRGTFRLVMMKDQPLKMAVATFTDSAA